MEPASPELNQKKLKSFERLSMPDKVKALLASVYEPVSSNQIAKWLQRSVEETDELINKLGIAPATKRDKLEIQRKKLENELANPKNQQFMDKNMLRMKEIEKEGIDRELNQNNTDLDIPLAEVVYGDPRGSMTLQEINVDPESVKEFIVNDMFTTIEDLLGSANK